MTADTLYHLNAMVMRIKGREKSQCLGAVALRSECSHWTDKKICIRRFEPGRWFTDFQLTQIRAVNATLPILSCFETPATWHHNPI